MKLQKHTIILVFMALALGGFVYFREIQPTSESQLQAQSKQLFDFKAEDIKIIIIKKPGQTLEFKALGQGKWQMQKPLEVAANDANLGFLVNLLVQGESSESFAIKPEEKSEYGLDSSQTEIIIELHDQTTQRLILGKPNFDQTLVYALVNPPGTSAETMTVMLVPINLLYGVDRELSEWHQKP